MINAPEPLLFIITTGGLFAAGALVPIFSWHRAFIRLSMALALLGSLYALVSGVLFFQAPSDQIPAANLLVSSWVAPQTDAAVQPKLDSGPAGVALNDSSKQAPADCRQAATPGLDTRSMECLPALRWSVRIDRLSAFFLVLIAAFAAIVAVYSIGALEARHFRRQRRGIAIAFNVLVWSTLMVVVSNDVFSLITMLEVMTLSFAYLTLYRHNQYLNASQKVPDSDRRRSARLAPQVYLMVSHTSTVFLVVALILLAINAGSLSFDSLRVAAPSLNPIMATVIFILALVGLGIRAGLTPAHFWVSLVHPASPTTTHALSLGIAIKVAIYLMLRFFFQFLRPEASWGYMLLLAAVGTALTCVWFAIASHDLKTALAYHSVENIGIIGVGIGVALVYQGAAMSATSNAAALPIAADAFWLGPAFPSDTARWLATLGLVAALYHLLNHAVFKGLLYLCTGAIDNLTNQVVDMEKLGGLIKIYRWTATCFLIGAIAIAGFPPLNGFVSEWLTLQALLYSLGTLPAGHLTTVLILVACLALLVASFALTAFCFLKIVGMTLLGTPRTSAAERESWSAHDAPWTMRLTMALMAVMCLILGLLPALFVRQIASIAEELIGGVTPIQPAPTPWLLERLMPQQVINLYLSPPAHASLQVAHLMAIFVLLWLTVIVLRLRNHRTLKPPAPWNGATPYEPAQMQLTSASLSYLIRSSIGGAAEQPTEARQPDYLPARLILSRSEIYPQAVFEFLRIALNRATKWLLVRSTWLGRVFQNGDLRRYLLYIFLVTIATLLSFLILEGMR
jgi:hydrogenase-4 component B